MVGTAGGATRGAGQPDDPFVAQVHWLIAAAGGKDRLVQRSGGLVSVRTLDNWTAGNYPRAKVTGAVRDLDAWASREMPGYPTAAGVPGLVSSCGPYRGAAIAGAATPAAPGADPTATATPEAPAARAPRARWRYWAFGTAALVVVAVASVVTTVLLVRPDRDTTPAAVAADSTKAAMSLVNLRLPSTGNGTPVPEQTGSIGANTFSDPRTLQDQEMKIPPHTAVMVRCRYYAPSVPSVVPDGFWYLIETDRWAGRWAPANSFMNGDLPGARTVHNTDFAVPVCH